MMTTANDRRHNNDLTPGANGTGAGVASRTMMKLTGALSVAGLPYPRCLECRPAAGLQGARLVQGHLPAGCYGQTPRSR